MSANPRWKMAVDVERCIGCHACSVACKVENNGPLGRFRPKVYYLDQGKFPKVTRAFLPALCMQCEDAPCRKACPHSAIDRKADGIVRVDSDKCVHDAACEAACPYGAIGCDHLTIAPSPLVGGQGWHDTVRSVAGRRHNDTHPHWFAVRRFAVRSRIDRRRLTNSNRDPQTHKESHR
jgi:Fe-S-cluster-containing dehydrogenase component